MNVQPVILPSVDVLVLGAGLAGLRAAWSALEEAPDASVLVASIRRGPSGSSFSNLHDKLGFHVPRGDLERETFVREVLTFAGRGFLDLRLVKILAEEAEVRCRDMEAIGVPFHRNEAGQLTRYASCFSQNSNRAVVFEGLSATYRAMAGKVSGLGARFLHDAKACHLVRDDESGRVFGALLRGVDGRLYAQPAKTVIAAMGGSAPLFLYSQAGAGNPGFGHGLLAESGALMANTRYLQWMWARMDNRVFWPAWSILQGRAELLHNGAVVDMPDHVRTAAATRATHCPYGNGLEDAALDHWLMDHRDEDGGVAIREKSPGNASTPSDIMVTLMGHASNGGAVIDTHARTTAPGLYAAGECATGMHGANRIGGAMVASCLVFGARAGKSAVHERTSVSLSEKSFARACEKAVYHAGIDLGEREAIRSWLAFSLQDGFFPNLFSDPSDWRNVLEERLRRTADAEARLMLRAAILLTTEDHRASHAEILERTA